MSEYVQDVRYIAGAGMRRSVFRSLLTALLLIFVPLSVEAVQSYSALYKVEGDGMSLGKLERKLEQTDDGSFILRTKSYTTGFWALFIKDNINEESRFAMVDGKVIPKSYHYTRKKKGKFMEERVVYDSDKGTILSTSADGKQSFPFTGGESDKLLYQFRIREALRGWERGESELQFSVVHRKQLRLYQFRVGEKLEELNTPLGKIEAVRVERINEGKRKTTLWFAPELDYLPVKIVQDAGDHNFSSIITSTSLK